jgi:hypothetical protein
MEHGQREEMLAVLPVLALGALLLWRSYCRLRLATWSGGARTGSPGTVYKTAAATGLWSR